MGTRISLALAALLAATSFLGSAHAQAMVSTKVTKVAGGYKITLIIGTAETMSMSSKGKADERMIGGKNATCSMAMHMMAELSLAGKSKPTCNHHVEVHVYNKKSGKVITNAKVAITLQGQKVTGGKMLMITVPIMTMEGMHAGPKDFHYGNNIYAPPGKYTVHVSVNGVRVNFSVSLVGSM